MKTAKKQAIIDWYVNSSDKAINIKTVPYRGIEPILDLVVKVLDEKGKVLYITGEDKEKVILVDELKKMGYTSFSIHQEFEIVENEDLVVCDYYQALRVKGQYDLVIYDDVNSFPIHKKPEMQHLIGLIYPRCKKVVAFSFDTVFFGVEVIEVPLSKRSGFVSEPRILETRLNLEEFIPNSVYEYLMWFVIEKKKVLFVTDNKKVKRKVSRFLMKIDTNLGNCIYDVDEIGTNEMIELSMDTSKPHIFITDDLDDYLDVPNNLEIIIHGADSSRYSYRELIFFCLRSGYYDDLNGEVILLCQTITRDIEKTRDMARYFNKVLWDDGFE